MSESEELAKLIDGAYRNILEKFNPCARQLISAGKAYLKALHGAMAASKAYIEAIGKMARYAHQGTWGGCTDIGTALMQLVEVQKDIQSQQMNILKAFYVDLLVPLESNLERDTKIVACEQKKFLHQHKCHQEAYLKASSCVKKQKKKSRTSRNSNLDKEIKQMQTLEEEKLRLDCFCEQSLKQAITQERRRYGFVLERQSSLTKHYLVYHSKGQSLLQHHLEEWEEISKTRESLPEAIENLFPSSNTLRVGSEYACANILVGMDMKDHLGNPAGTNNMRKTRSIDASCLDIRELPDVPYPRPLSRAKSDFNLASSSASLVSSEYVPLRPKSMVEPEGKNSRRQVRALYSYLSSGEHQLSFHEGDVIALIGERNKGWQYGENLRNHRCGWFPIAYTEPVHDSKADSDDTTSTSDYQRHSTDLSVPSTFSDFGVSRSKTIPNIRPYSSNYASSFVGNDVLPPPPPTVQRPLSTFIDSCYSRTSDISKVCPVGAKHNTLPTTPTASLGPCTTPTASTPTGPPLTIETTTLRPPRRSMTSPLPLPHPPPRLPGSTSLHSSNDSGFCNDGGPQPPSQGQKEDDSPRDNVFATVKLRKVVTNDRSAPMIT